MRIHFHYMLLSLILLLSVSALNMDMAQGEMDPNFDLISVAQTADVVDQYGTFGISVELENNLTLDDVVIATNIEAVVKGIPSLSEQLPFGKLKSEFNIDRVNESLKIQFQVIDQMIWFDGERMLENVTVTLA